MTEPVWIQVRKTLGFQPLVAGLVAGAHPVYVERYLFQTSSMAAPGFETIALLTQFAASPVNEIDGKRLRSRYLPTQSLLVPRNTPTHWVFSGAADFALLYFLDDGSPLMESLRALTHGQQGPMPFGDALVGAAALQLVNEVQRGPGGNPVFMESLLTVILEQTLRALTSSGLADTDPRHMHYPRIQTVLSHIRNNLTGDLSIPSLADVAGMSPTHFRRVFQEVVGISIHRYVLTSRLDQARAFLGMSAMHLVRVAQECGFSSQSHFTLHFRKVYGMTPAEFRNQLSNPDAVKVSHPSLNGNLVRK